MKERLKTFLLVFLVSISIIITQKLWISMPTFTFDVFGSKIDDSFSYVLGDMIVANKYQLNFSENSHTLVYDDSKYGIWQSSKESLRRILAGKSISTEIISEEEYLQYKKNKSVIFYLPEKMNTYILAKVWDVKKPNNIVDSMPNIDSIFIYLGSGDPFFVFSNGEDYLKVYDKSIDIKALKDQINQIGKEEDYVYYYSMKETLGIKNDILIPYNIKNSLPEVYIENEVASMDYSDKSNLVERFFNKSIDYVREIVEKNGSSIYVYEQKVLKLDTNGMIEFFEPLDESIKDRNLYKSLSAASNFISEKSNLQKGVYLAKIKKIESDGSFGYKLLFRYRIRGIPVILGNQEVGEYVEMDVFNDHIRNYKHYARKDMNKVPYKILSDDNMLSAFDAIDKNAALLKRIYLEDGDANKDISEEDLINETLSSIEDVTLAYFDPCIKDKNEKLIVVWVINFKNRLLAFDAVNGMLVYQR